MTILTKFIGPTDYKGSRVKAYTESGLQLTIGWDHGLSVEDNHFEAAKAFAKKMGWNGRWFGEGTKEGYAFVNYRAKSFVNNGLAEEPR